MDFSNITSDYEVISFVGQGGAFGRFVKEYGGIKPLGITSIGRGGDIRVKKNMYIATAAGVLGECDFTKEIVHTTGMNTPMGEVIVTQALSDGRAVLAGPSINSQLSRLCRYFLDEIGVGQVYIDGAGDKRTFASCSDAVVVGLGCEYISRLIGLPHVSEMGGDVDIHDVSGALTDEMLEDFNAGNVVVEDMSKIFVKPAVLDRFLHRGGILYVKNKLKLINI